MTKVVQSLWVGDSLSLLEQLSIKSFLAHGHEYHLYSYKKLPATPAGVVTCDANEILPEKSVFHVDGSVALFSDWFRWELLYKRGGMWVDLDLVCLRPLMFDDELIFGKEGAELVNLAVLKFPAGHRLCGMMRDVCSNPFRTMPFDRAKDLRRKRRGRLLRSPYKFLRWGDVGGPLAFTRALLHLDLFKLAKPYTWFYPITSTNYDAFFEDSVFPNQDIATELFANSYTIHVWNEFFRRNSIDKNASFPEQSLYERAKRMYL